MSIAEIEAVETIDHLDFHLRCGSRSVDCKNEPEWFTESICCKTTYPICDYHKRQYEESCEPGDLYQCGVCGHVSDSVCTWKFFPIKG